MFQKVQTTDFTWRPIVGLCSMMMLSTASRLGMIEVSGDTAEFLRRGPIIFDPL